MNHQQHCNLDGDDHQADESERAGEDDECTHRYRRINREEDGDRDFF
jgi:hypothetical protein